ncbi:hypothetical protein OS121_03215 [Mycolicibacterium mucogenicum]|uniref:WXG100-like domain-containing protein n=1 Tax=Mycolicibacterium mucogenicum TaxID=56689 RepID=UPI00226A7356|nr:hypothetical protein [Mycolicibacterium mucogenicum]MCX8554111.1 hypothetical protein [Mycolicibacterium mucogenicum]
MPGRIEVEPDALIAAGQIVLAAGEQLGALSEAVKPMVAEGLASGFDLAGFNMGVQYGRQSQEFTNTLAGAANAFKSVGYRLMASGHNYRDADAASTIGGSGPSGGLGPAPQESHPGQAARMPQNLLVPPPPKWNLITMFLPVNTWPNGHAGLMKVTAAQWRNFANGFKVFDSMLTAPKAVVGAQHIDESGKMKEALNTLGENIKSLTEISDSVAKAVEDYANQVQETQNAIRRILNRLSLDGLFDAAKDILTGDGMKLVREVADNIKALWHNFQTNVKAVTGLLGEALTLLGEAADAFQKMIRPVLIAVFGDDIGGALADGIKFYTDVQVGLISGLVGTVSGLVSLADFDTWKGMYDVATMIAKDPSKTDDVLIAMGKQFVAWDKWSGDHPGRALGEAGFNIGSLFVPGGALSKTGSVAKGAKLAKDLASGERKLSDLARLGPRGRGSVDAGDHDGLEGLSDLGNHTQAPRFDGGAMPEIGDAPRPPTIGDPSGGTPRGLGGPPDPPGPDHTPVRPGGDGPGQHSGPPERSSGPADAGPSRHDGPQSSGGPTHSGDGPQSSSGPGSNGQGSHGPTSDGARSTEPPAAAHTPSDSSHGPSQSQHSPQNSTDTSTHDQGNSSPAHDQRGSHDTTASRDTGGHTPSDTGHRGDADSRPGDHTSGAERHSGNGEHPGSRESPSPTDHSRTHDSPTTDGAHRTDHTAPSHVTDAPAHRDTDTNASTNSLANAMNMGGPMGPVGHHAPGGHSTPGGGHSANPTSSHTPTPNTERPAGTPTPRDTTAKNPPPQRPTDRAAAGPARDTNPSPPVKPAAAQGESHAPEHKQPSTEQPQRPSSPREPDHDSGPRAGQGAENLRPAAEHPQPAPSGPHTEDHPPSGTPSHAGDRSDAPRPDPVDAVMPVLDRHGVTLNEFIDWQRTAAVVGREHLAEHFSHQQLQVMYEARMAHPHPGPNDTIQKVVGEGAVKSILEQIANPGSRFGGGGEYRANGAGGCVSVASDAAKLRTPSDLLHALRLDYGDGSPYEVFTTTDHAYVVEGRVTTGELRVPNGRITDRLGIADPYTRDLRFGDPPHTGTGYTGAGDGLNPEYQLIDGQWAPGAELVRIDPDGSRHTVARLADEDTWVPAKAPDDHVVDGWPQHKGGDWVFPDSTQHGPHPEPPDATHRGPEFRDTGPPPDRHSSAGAADAFRHSTFETPAGAAFFDPADAHMRAAAGDVPRFPGEFTVDVHGDHHSVSVYDSAGNQHQLSPHDFADAIRNSGWDGQTPIRLMSCDTGSGNHSFAADLARELGVRVTAPDRPVWSYPDGRPPVVTGFDRDPDGERVPRIPPDGSWHQFEPDGTARQAPDSPGPDHAQPDAHHGNESPDSADPQSRAGREIPDDPIDGLEGRHPPAGLQEKVDDARYREKYYDEVRTRDSLREGSTSTEPEYRRRNENQLDFDGDQVPLIRRDEVGAPVAVPDGYERATIADGETLVHGANPQERHAAQELIDRREAARDHVVTADAAYQAERAGGGEASPETISERQAAFTEQTAAGEALGEHAATHAMENTFPGSQFDVTPLQEGLKGPGTFDHVYEVRDRESGETRVVVVEAKGPSGHLGTRQGVDGVDYQQGHREYAASVINAMLKSGPEGRQLAWRLREALLTDQLDYYLVRAKVEITSGGAEYGGYRMDRFALD